MSVNFVLNYGRVGSVGIAEALNEADCGPVLHIHKADTAKISSELTSRLMSKTPIPQDLLWSAAASGIRDSNVAINVICPIREPITRDVSAVTYGRPELDSYLSGEEFINDFFGRDYSFASKWIVDELGFFTNIDIYSQYFDKDKGYNIFENRNIRLLVLQSELDNKRKSDSLQDFLDLKSPPLIHSSVNSSGYELSQLRSIGPRIISETDKPLKTDPMIATHFYTEKQLQVALDGLDIKLEQLDLPKHDGEPAL